ncbi:pectin methylesterase-like acyl-CoA thioesterase [Allocatelliglobosispora scoriae]|uniref:Pectinesterase n=1 Tax=Allocatelliglobosispora scoriae TaxID=643052 RepID=A0A841BMZ0_9ACTN|nr:pectinesterase family protein [Allocatelliglobosispora scoriae]MBB5868112.1 pectin methylesterase-like acyl-CoA thioesterase [Allocatelliglobosispora scoriae]
MTLPRSLRRALWQPVAVAAAALAMVAALSPSSATAATLFADDFEDGNSAGWTTSAGTWSVVADGTSALRQSGTSSDTRARAGSSSWTNYTVTARVKPVAFNGSNRFVALLARAQSDTSYYYVTLRSTNVFELKKLVSGSSTTLATTSVSVAAGTWYTVSLTVSGSSIRGSVNGTTTLSATDSQFSSGGIGVATYYASASFDDVTVADSATPSPSASASAPPSPSPSPSSPPGTTIVVAKDGSGNYSTVQAAVNAVPTNNTRRVTITIKPGTYRELVTVPSNKPYISFIGSTGSASDVVITYDNASGTPKPDGSGTYGTTGSSSVVIDANDFIAKNLTFANTFDEAAHDYSAEQAVAVTTRGDRLVFDNVRFLGNQDTLQPSSPSTATVSRAYYRNCYIEGDVDFIFGRGTAVFDRCEIRSLNRNSSSNNGYITAASTTNTNPYGYLFTQCTLSAQSGTAAQSVHLGRPWHPSGDVNAIAQVLYRNSTLGAHIKGTPWADMSGFSWRDARFTEYLNTGPGSTVTADRPQLAAASAPNYTAQKFLAGSDGWNPVS